MLKDMAVMHPAAKMLVDLSAAQDVEAGDGTTSVVVICGSLLGAAERLLGKGEQYLHSITVARWKLTYQRHSPDCHLRSLPKSRCRRRTSLARHVTANLPSRPDRHAPSRLDIALIEDRLATLEPSRTDGC